MQILAANMVGMHFSFAPQSEAMIAQQAEDETLSGKKRRKEYMAAVRDIEG